MADTISEIKKLLKEKKLVFGSEVALKGLRKGIFSKIYLSSNCSEIVKEDIKHYASISGVEVLEIEFNNQELGDICKKPFSISVIGLKK